MTRRMTNNEDSEYRSRLALIERRLARSEAARIEAEQLLETKSRSLAASNDALLQKEEKLLEQVNRNTLSLVSAQNLADVGTFHGDASQRFYGSENFADVVGSKTPITSFEQLAAMVHPLDRAEAFKILYSATQWGLVDQDVKRDVRFIDKDGQVRWLRWSVTQHQSQDNASYSGYGAVRDITRERKAERQQQLLRRLTERRYKQVKKLSDDLQKSQSEEQAKSEQLAQRLKETEVLGKALEEARATAVAANKSKSRFLAMMSHDIRTPMNAILATLEMLGISELNSVQRKQLELARTSSDQLLFLLADIIEYARTDGWRIALNPQVIAVSDIVTKIADTWQPLARKKRLKINTNIGDDCPKHMMIDATRVRQVIDNFVSNAIKYTNDGDIFISATTIVQGSDWQLKIDVRDTGDGIAPDLQSRLFEDFNRGLNANSEIEGTGLGLSICRRVIDAMGGTIGLESEIGQGSNFWFSIPVLISDGTAQAKASDTPQDMPSLSIDDRKPKLLVAEDIEANQIVISAMLDRLGCESKIVGDGLLVLKALTEEQFDGILMDVSMPNMDGMEATQTIRIGVNQPNIPIFGVTAFAANEERTTILASGMNGLVPKPINLAGLHQVIAQICSASGDLDDDNKTAEISLLELQTTKFIDVAKLQEQLNGVPQARRSNLVDAIANDLTHWSSQFSIAWVADDTAELARAHHALQGICKGFGASALLEKIDIMRQETDIRLEKELLLVEDILQSTIKSLRQSSQSHD